MIMERVLDPLSLILLLIFDEVLIVSSLLSLLEERQSLVVPLKLLRGFLLNSELTVSARCLFFLYLSSSRVDDCHSLFFTFYTLLNPLPSLNQIYFGL